MTDSLDQGERTAQLVARHAPKPYQPTAELPYKCMDCTKGVKRKGWSCEACQARAEMREPGEQPRAAGEPWNYL